MQRMTQKFPAAEKVYRANPRSGETEEVAQKIPCLSIASGKGNERWSYKAGPCYQVHRGH